MTLLKDLINIPERVHQGDFVLKLSEGVAHADATLRDYVVTPQLVDCFDNALGFIKQSIESGCSKAAYIPFHPRWCKRSPWNAPNGQGKTLFYYCVAPSLNRVPKASQT